MSTPKDFLQHVKISQKPHFHLGNSLADYIDTLTISEYLTPINYYLPTVPQDVNWYLCVIDGVKLTEKLKPKQNTTDTKQGPR